MIPVFDGALKGSAIVLIAFAVLRLWRARPAAARHLVLASALACAAAVPLIGMAVPSWRVEAPAPVSAVSVTYEAVLPGTVDTPQAGATGPFPVATVLAAMWIGGAAVGLMILLTGLARLAWIARYTTPVETGTWAVVARQLAGEFGLARPPRLLQSDHPALLVTWGCLDPKVLLPGGAAAWTEDRVRVALAHELAHVRRRDWIVQIGAELLRSVYWFNPLLWIGCARLRQESEQACDDAVLRLGVGGTAYAGHLLDLARAFRAHRRVWLPAPAIARPSSLERRVRAMLNTHTDRRPVTFRTAAAVLSAFLGVTAAIAGFDAFAQSRFATLSGIVVDQSGGVLVNATLVLSNPGTNAKNEVRTNETGFYEIVGLPAGDYELEVRQLGFQSAKEAVSIGVGESLQRNVSLQVGSVQETIVTSAGAVSAAPATPRTASAPARRPCPNPAVGGCIRPPVKVKDVRPIYPATLSDAGVQGVVLLEATIASDGRTNVVRVVSSPHPDLERAAIDAVSQWEFAPTTLNDSVIDTPMNISVTFRLPEAAAQP